MKRNNKKGFTIVELVIVIAVIAILAAVLIPTFASLVGKAQEAADTQLAKNLNTALTMAEAEGNGPETFTEVLKVLRDSGYLVGNLNPTTEGWYYVWEEESNQILLVDGNDNFSVKYSSKTLVNDEIGATWNIAVSDPEIATDLKEKGAKVAYSVLEVENIQSVIDAALEGGEVVIAEGITLDNDKTIILDNKDANVTLKLEDSVVTSSAVLSEVPFYVAAGSLTIEGGTISALAGAIDADGKYITRPIETLADSYTKIDGTTFSIATDNGYCCFLGDADLDNVTINSSGMGVYCGADANVVLENVTINSEGRCVWATNYNGDDHDTASATITIKSGTYNGGTGTFSDYAAVPVVAFSGDIIIEGGNFTTGSGKFFQVMHGNGSITLKGGTFGGKTLSQLVKTDIEKLCNGTFKVTDNNDGTFTITLN